MTDELVRRLRDGWTTPADELAAANRIEALTAEVARLREAKTVAVKVKQLVWHNFDAWTHWAEGACGTYHVEERNGYWQVELRVGGLVHGVTQADDTTPADLDAAKAAAQADYEARVLAALDVQPGYTTDDLRRAWEAGRAEAMDACDWGDIYGDNAVKAIRALTPPADLAEQVTEGRDNGI